MEASQQALELTERLADRLCHDVSSSAQAIASGLDLLGEAGSPAERDEALAFLAEAVAAQRSKVRYARRAYGPVGQGTPTSELKTLAEGLYADLRPTLDWAIEPQVLGPAASRALLSLLQIAADALAVGGLARASAGLDGGRLVVAVDAEGARVAVRDEVRAGLAGAPFQAGLGGRWVQGAFVANLAAASGGTIDVEAREGAARFAVSLPPGA